MCGPLLLSLSNGHGAGAGDRQTFKPLSGVRWSLFWDKFLYHMSRVWMYTLFGLLVGFIGRGLESLPLESLQMSVSLFSGLLLLVFVFFAPKLQIGHRLSVLITSQIIAWQREHGRMVQAWLGALNALLPCGMVYVALATALGTGSVLGAGILMFFFGLGTVPAMLGVSVFGESLMSFGGKRWPVKKISVYACSGLLILRGLGLGIPFLSPEPGYSDRGLKIDVTEKESLELVSPCCSKE
jgi:sulfite exporter TauE/SafE